MKILVVGLGAMGTVYSCLLKEHGHQVTCMVLETIVDIVRTNGLKVTGIWGEHRARPDRCLTNFSEIMDTDFDLVVLTVKSFDTCSTSLQISKVMGRNTYVLLAQNGYGNYEAASRSIPEDRIILGRLIFGAEAQGIGESEVTVIADDVVIGSPSNLIPMEIVERFAQVFSASGIPTRTSPEVSKYMWGKIIYNSALNPLGAILEVNYGKLAEDENSRLIMNGIIEEIFAVLKAMKLDIFWPDASTYLSIFYDRLIPDTGAHRSSMLQDIQRGRRTEIDALNGAVVELGRKFNVDTPLNGLLTNLIKAKERLVLKTPA